MSDVALDGSSIEDEHRARAEVLPTVGLSNPRPGIPWVIGIFVGATVSYLLSRWIYGALNIADCAPTCALFSIGTSTLGAAIATAFALAGMKPFDRVNPPGLRASIVLAASFVLVFAFWTVFAGVFGYDMGGYAFPIIGTVWFFIAATSFVGEDAHVAHLTPGRRTLLNLVLWIVATAIVVRAIGWLPPFWFGFVQTLLITGGFAYLLRGIRQPTKSFYAWAILALLTGVAIIVSSALGVWDIAAPRFGPWAFGGPTPEWGIFFALWCGLNFGVLAPLQSWPFSRIRQPWGTTVAIVAVIAWCILLTLLLNAVFGGIFADPALALLEAQVWGWHTVIWGFSFALLFGAGSTPYLWKGQQEPGSWEAAA